MRNTDRRRARGLSTPARTESPGFRMYYVDEHEGETSLALHGEPTWGYLFRNLIPALAPRHRVIAPAQ